MSGPQLPSDGRQFLDELAAFNLAVGEWLGLDPTQVFHFDLAEGKEPEFAPHSGVDGGEYTTVTWESAVKQEPRIGHVTHGGRSDEDLGIVYTAKLVIDWMDDRDRIEAVGRKPKMFSDADEARLRAMFGA